MIYVSSACSRQKRIGPAVRELAEYGFRHIELTGGTSYYEGYEEDLLRLHQRYGLTYLIHNYFPPPRQEFVVNLASPDHEIFRQSLHLLQQAIELAKKVGSDKFGFHAGLMVDAPPGQLGGAFRESRVADQEEAISRFCQGYRTLLQGAAGVRLYLENHVYSAANHAVHGDSPPLMLLTHGDYLELLQRIPFRLLLDVGHLKVTSTTLGLDFEKVFHEMFNNADYIHISDNDGLADQNKALSRQSPLYALCASHLWQGKTISLEVYDGLPAVARTMDLLLPLVS